MVNQLESNYEYFIHQALSIWCTQLSIRPVAKRPVYKPRQIRQSWLCHISWDNMEKMSAYKLGLIYDQFHKTSLHVFDTSESVQAQFCWLHLSIGIMFWPTDELTAISVINNSLYWSLSTMHGLQSSQLQLENSIHSPV